MFWSDSAGKDKGGVNLNIFNKCFSLNWPLSDKTTLVSDVYFFPFFCAGANTWSCDRRIEAPVLAWCRVDVWMCKSFLTGRSGCGFEWIWVVVSYKLLHHSDSVIRLRVVWYSDIFHIEPNNVLIWNCILCDVKLVALSLSKLLAKLASSVQLKGKCSVH